MNGVSVKRGVEVGVGVTFLYFVNVFFSFFFSQFASAVYRLRHNIFRYKGNKENKKMCLELLFRIIPNSRVIFQSTIEVANFFSSSTPIFAIEVHK